MTNYALVLTGPDISADDVAALSALVAAELRHSRPPSADMLAASRAYQWLVDLDAGQSVSLLSALRVGMSGIAADINLVPADEFRRKRLLIADMDSTIIEQECIDEIADFAGHGAEVAAITERAMRGELDFEAALKTRVALLEGLTSQTLEQVAAERLAIMQGAATLVATMTANGAYCALVSGGFTFFTSRIAAAVGFHENRANTLEMDAGRLTGRVVPPILGRQAKLDALMDLTNMRQIPLSAALAVGDGANDLAMIGAAGLGVAYRAKPVVAAEADAQITHGDLTALLYLQGYHHNQFVS